MRRILTEYTHRELLGNNQNLGPFDDATASSAYQKAWAEMEASNLHLQNHTTVYAWELNEPLWFSLETRKKDSQHVLTPIGLIALTDLMEEFHQSAEMFSPHRARALQEMENEGISFIPELR